MIYGLSTINLELTSRCDKNCWMCGRRKIERDYPELANWGDIDYNLVESIASQLPEGIVIQFHNNGESLLYPRFGEAVSLFKGQIKCIDTNGKQLIEKFGEIVENLDTITVSTFERDVEADEQYEILKEFLQLKGERKPQVIVRCLGEVELDRYRELGCLIATRILHSPMGSFGYKRRTTIPEIGICLEALHHLSIDRKGGVSMCVRFDPRGENVVGDANKQTLDRIWNGEERGERLALHIAGQRSKIPFCDKCEFWGVPTG